MPRAVLGTLSEHEEQVAVMAWAGVMAARFPALRLLFAVPNGARTGMRTAVKLKREGLRAGVPDLFLPAARAGYNGLFLELKRVKGGRVSDVQREWHAELRLAGYAVAVCHGADEAQQCLASYLSGSRLGRFLGDGGHDAVG